MKSILILGSEGFIGKHLVTYYLSAGYKVFGCDLCEPFSGAYSYSKLSQSSPEWDYIFARNSYDVCINAAGSGNVPYSIEHPVMDFEANTSDTMKILDIIRKTQPQCKYLHISSAAVYGDPPTLPVREDLALHPLSPYGWHKFMSELLCREYHELFGLKVAIIRPFSVYGNGLRKQLLWDICQKMQQQPTVTLFGTGKESRDFIHVDDLVRLFDCVVQRCEFNGSVYNAASGIETTIRSIADIFEKHFGGEKNIGFSGQARAGDPVNWRADIRKVRSLGFEPATNLEEGIKSYIEWHLNL